jgi:hypothetical protein
MFIYHNRNSSPNMETHSRSNRDPARPIGSKLKKKSPAAKDAARAAAPDSSGVKEKHDTATVAASTGFGGNQNDSKMQEELNAPAVPTGSSGIRVVDRDRCSQS